jgi:hypothetical protein
MKKLLLTGAIVLRTAVSASAGPEAEHRGHWISPGQWQMNDIGRNHGVLGGPGIPKCNPWVRVQGVPRWRFPAVSALSATARAANGR